MSQYFVIITGDHLVPKNNLHKEWKKWCKRNQHILIVGETQLQHFIEDVKAAIERLNNLYPKCHPLNFYQYQYNHFDVGDQIVGVSEVCLFTIHKVKTVVQNLSIAV